MRRTRFNTAHCPVARVTDLFGDWWTPLVLRDAMFGTTRFADFQRQLDMSRAVLSARLTRLVDEGLMEKVAYQDNPPRFEYRLTEKGWAAADVLAAMWRFGEDHMWVDEDGPMVELADRETQQRIRPRVFDETTGSPLDLDNVKIRRARREGSS